MLPTFMLEEITQCNYRSLYARSGQYVGVKANLRLTITPDRGDGRDQRSAHGAHDHHLRVIIPAVSAVVILGCFS